MKKDRTEKAGKLACLVCACAALFAGCGGSDVSGEDPEDGKAEQETEDVKEPSDEWRERLRTAQVRHYYGGVLSQMIGVWQLPDMELDVSYLGEGREQMGDNCFAVTDIDGDGREELIICYSTANMAGMFQAVYDYDPAAGQLKREFIAFPSVAFYDNGVIKAEDSHNHSRGMDFWPFSLYQYRADSDSYEQIAYVDTWSRDFADEWQDGQPFPDGLDTDGDGILYNIQEGAEASLEFSDYKYNKADYESWYQSIMEGADEIQIDYLPLAYDSFADYTPAYLRLLADEAGKGRTDTGADLGLLILNEDSFLNAAQTLLSQEYGVKIEQPEENFEERRIGVADGREIFSFTALDAGEMSYQDEKVGDVTIFGLYPGISVDGAWEKLRAYGFYASPYGEVENCLITGEGFGNVSIWFAEEKGKVTSITVRPFCAFAG